MIKTKKDPLNEELKRAFKEAEEIKTMLHLHGGLHAGLTSDRKGVRIKFMHRRS